jgi:hypothetical protein
MNAVIPFESIGLFLPMKKGGTAKSTPFVLLLDERSFLFCLAQAPDSSVRTNPPDGAEQGACAFLISSPVYF